MSHAKAFERPFKQAFAEPAWFSRYARTFEGMLDPGITIPFGDGLNEVQVYGK